MGLTHQSLWEYQLSQWRWNLIPKRKFSMRQLREHAAMTGEGT